MSKKVLVETSARHIHLTDEAVAALYGADAKLEVKKMLSQPGQFATTNEKIKVVGPKGELKCSILGPERKADQVELSLTDARTIGVSAAVRESGDIAGTDGCILRGPCGEVKIENGIIAAKRHIHMTPADAATYGVSDKEIVSVKIDNCKRPLIFGDVVVRVSENFALAMHIDTDECNAAGISGNASGEIVK